MARPGWRGLLVLALAAAPGWPPPVAAQVSSGRTAGGIQYEVSGQGDALVLIHAFSLDSRMWARQVAAWEGQYRVTRYDLRGHGGSAPPTEPYAGYDDLRELLDTLGVRQATLVGLSAGAELALNFALVHPERVEALVLAGPGLGGFAPPPMPWFAPVAEALGAGDPQRAMALWAATPMMRLHRNTAASDQVARWAGENWRLWTFQRLERPLAPPAIGRLGEVRVPTLIVVGERDEAHIHEISRLLAARIPGAVLQVVPGAGHLVSLDAPDEFSRLVAEFRARGAPPPTPDPGGHGAQSRGFP